MINLLKRFNIRLGSWSSAFAEDYAACEGCGTPWKFVDGHATKFTGPDGQDVGMTVVCVRCWPELTKVQRLECHKRVWERWLQSGRDRRNWWPLIEIAVLHE